MVLSQPCIANSFNNNSNKVEEIEKIIDKDLQHHDKYKNLKLLIYYEKIK